MLEKRSHRTILFILFLGTQFFCASQDKKIKYKSISKKNIEVTQDIPELLEKAREFKKDNPTEALDIIEEALALSIAEENRYNQAKCYVFIGELNKEIREWDLAIENYEKAKNLLTSQFKNPQSKTEYVEVIEGLGSSYFKLKNYEKSISYNTSFLRLNTSDYKKTDATLLLAKAYYKKRNWQESQRYLMKAENYSKALNNYQKKAIDTHKKLLLSKTDTKDTIILMTDSVPLRGTYNTNKTSDETFSWFNSSGNANQETISESFDEKIVLSNTLFEDNRVEESLKELDEAERLALKNGTSEDKILLYQTQAKLYDKAGDKEKALDAYQKLDSERIKKEQNRSKFSNRRSKIIKRQNAISSLSKDVELDQKDYELATKDELIRYETLRSQRLIIYGLLFIVLLLIVASFFIYKNAKASKIANELLALKSLRGQMNPHFIFNALNSVNHFISQNDERSANKFLSEFSKLMRLVLEHSQEDFITLQTEKEIVGLYLKLEHYRFRDKFEYEFNIDENINLDTIEIPPMLIQPYIENAVWHGLRYKKEIGHLSVAFVDHEKFIQINIKDDGIGRKKSQELKTEHQKEKTSIGLKNIEERLKIINRVYKINCEVSIHDVDQENTTGTEVEIRLFKK